MRLSGRFTPSSQRAQLSPQQAKPRLLCPTRRPSCLPRRQVREATRATGWPAGVHGATVAALSGPPHCRLPGTPVGSSAGLLRDRANYSATEIAL